MSLPPPADDIVVALGAGDSVVALGAGDDEVGVAEIGRDQSVRAGQVDGEVVVVIETVVVGVAKDDRVAAA